MDPYNSVNGHDEDRVMSHSGQSQTQELLTYLNRWGHGITTFEAYSELGITQLTARLSELKKRGHQFRSEWVKGRARNGRRYKIKRYWLV